MSDNNKMTKKLRETKMNAIVDDVDNWRKSDLIDYIKTDKRRDLEEMTDEEIQEEYWDLFE